MGDGVLNGRMGDGVLDGRMGDGMCFRPFFPCTVVHNRIISIIAIRARHNMIYDVSLRDKITLLVKEKTRTRMERQQGKR